MKLKHPDELQSGFWLKLIATLASVGTVVVLVFGGIQNVMQQFSDLQNELDSTSDALDENSRQLEQTSSDLLEASAALKNTRSVLSVKGAELDEAHSELADTKAELESARLQLADVARDRDETAAALDITQSELADTRTQLDQLTAELGQKQDTIDDLESTRAVTQRNLAKAADELDQSLTANAELRLERETLTADLAGSQRKEYRARSALRKAEAQLNAVGADLTVAEIYAAQLQLESVSHIWTLAYASCIVEEYVSLAQYYYEQEREFSAEQIERFQGYLTEFEPDGSYNPVPPYCSAIRDIYGGYPDEEAVEESATDRLANETDMATAKAKVALGNLIRQTMADDESVIDSGSLVRQWQTLLPGIHQRIVQLLGAELAAKSVELKDGALYILVGTQ